MGLYFDHARFYDSEIGRFVSQDPKGFAAGDTNLYRYVGNDPTNARDTSGNAEGPKGGKLDWDVLAGFGGSFGFVPPTSVGDIENKKYFTNVRPILTGTLNPTDYPGGGIKITTNPEEGAGNPPITVEPIGTWPITPPGFKPSKNAEYELNKLWESLGGYSWCVKGRCRTWRPAAPSALRLSHDARTTWDAGVSSVVG